MLFCITLSADSELLDAMSLELLEGEALELLEVVLLELLALLGKWTAM